MSVYTKLASIQSELFVPKGQFNGFGKYSYRSCEDVLKALKPICKENECVVFITNDLENIGDRNYVKATVTLVDLETGEKIVSTAHAREEETKKGMDGSQITGASSSYARKYALAGLFGIDNESDSDATNKGETHDSGEQALNDAELKARVIGYINRHKFDNAKISAICKAYKVEKLTDLKAKDCEDYIKKLEEKGMNVDE